MANSVYSSLDGLTIPPRTLDTSRETSATGPTASCRDEPNIAYTNNGTKPVSVQNKEMERYGLHYQLSLENIEENIKRRFKDGNTYKAHKLGADQKALRMTLPTVQHKKKNDGLIFGEMVRWNGG
jgi:hypothetical protein